MADEASSVLFQLHSFRLQGFFSLELGGFPLAEPDAFADPSRTSLSPLGLLTVKEIIERDQQSSLGGGAR